MRSILIILLVVLATLVWRWWPDAELADSAPSAPSVQVLERPRLEFEAELLADGGADSERSGGGMTMRIAQRIQIPADRSREVSGRVLGPDGSPVEAATVTLHQVLSPWPRQELRPLANAYTGPSGTFLFHAAEGVDLLVEAVADGLARIKAPISARIDDATIRMTHGFEVTGFVHDKNGSLVPGCEVLLEPGSWGNHRAQLTRTDDYGRFRFTNLPAGLVG